MTSRAGNAGKRKQTPVRIQQNGGPTLYVPRHVVDQMKEATKASDEDIQLTLTECSGDVNEATARLIESPFKVVTSKKKVKQEERKKMDRGGPPRGHSNLKPGEDARALKPGRGTEPGAANNTSPKGQRGDGRGKPSTKLVSALKAANKPRSEDESGAKKLPNNRVTFVKEAESKEVRPLTPTVAVTEGTPEKGAPAPVKTRVGRPAPIKTGYADALCRNITKYPMKDGAIYLQGVAMDGSPRARAAEAIMPKPWPKQPLARGVRSPEQIAEDDKIVNEKRLKAFEEHVAPFDDFKHISEQDAKAEEEPATATENPKVAEKQQAMVAKPLEDYKKQEAQGVSVPPEVLQEQKQKEYIPTKPIPAFLAPILDLLLETPPLGESSMSFRFGTFPGVEAVLNQILVTEARAAPQKGTEDMAAHTAKKADDFVPREEVTKVSNEAHEQSPVEVHEHEEPLDGGIHVSVSAPAPLQEPEPEEVTEAMNEGEGYAQKTAADEFVEVSQDVENDETGEQVPDVNTAGVEYDAPKAVQQAPSTVQNTSAPVQDYKPTENTAYQGSQYADVGDQTHGQDMKQHYGTEGQVTSGQRQHLQDRTTYEPGQHAANPSPTIPPYRQKQDDRAPAHTGHQHHTRLVGQVSTGAQTDANAALGNQTTGGNSTPSSVAGGVVAAPHVRPGPTPTPHIPQVPYGNPMIPSPAMPFPAHYYPQYMQAHQFNAMAAYHGLYPGTYGYNGAYSHATESTGYPAPHLPPGGAPPKYLPPYNAPAGANAINQAYAANYPAGGIYGLGGNSGYEATGVSAYSTYKEKDNIPQQQQQQQHSAYGPGIVQQGPRSDLYYGVPSQGYTGQGFRNQGYHHQGYGAQFGGGAPPPHNFHNVGGQQNNFRLH